MQANGEGSRREEKTRAQYSMNKSKRGIKRNREAANPVGCLRGIISTGT